MTAPWILAPIALAWASGAGALQPLITDDTGTQGSGGNQIEVAFDRERLRSNDPLQTTRTLGATHTRGLTQALDAFVAASLVDIRPGAAGDEPRGAGNPVVGLKWRFWESDPQGLSVGLKPEIGIARSAEAERDGLASGRTSYALTVIATKEFPGGAVHLNAAAARVGYTSRDMRAANRRSLYRLSLAPVIELSADWRLALDFGATTNPDRAERARMGYAEIGAIWAPYEDLELAFGWIADHRDGDPRRRSVTLGLTWRFR